MATLTLNIKYNVVTVDGCQNSDKNKALVHAGKILTRIATGSVPGGVDVQLSSADPVAASGTATITYASIAAADTITIGGVVLTCVASGATGPQFNKVTDATATAASLVTAINTTAALSKHVVATSALGVVTVRARLKGSLANLITLAATGTGIAVTQMTGGAGGPENTSVSYGG